MEVAIALIIGFGIFALIIIWAVKYTKKINGRKSAFYSDFARKHNLNHSSSKYMLTALNVVEGVWNEMPFVIYEQMEGSGKSKTVVTRAIIENVPFDYDFKIGKEHLFSKASKMLGMKDIEFGDAEFDKKFLIKAKDEDKFRSFFNYKLQGELSNLQKDLAAAIRVDSGIMTYMHYGPIANNKRFESFEKVVEFMFLMVKEAQRSRS